MASNQAERVATDPETPSNLANWYMWQTHHFEDRLKSLTYEVTRFLSSTVSEADVLAFLRSAAQIDQGYQAHRVSGEPASYAPSRVLVVEDLHLPDTGALRQPALLFDIVGQALVDRGLVARVTPDAENPKAPEGYIITSKGLSLIRSTGWGYDPGATPYDLAYGVKL